jgi:integrase
MTFKTSQMLPSGGSMKFTQGTVSKLTSSKSDEIFFDDELPNFGLRIRAGGSRKYIVQYRIAGNQRRFTIGRADAMTLEQARHKARKVLVEVGEGKDPAAEKDARHIAAGLLFGAVAQKYLAARSDLRPRSMADCKRYLTVLLKPLDKLALNAISRAVVANQLRVIVEKHGNVQANRSRSYLSALFAWAIGEGLCETNPVIGTNKQVENDPRERSLSDVELAAVWQACPDSDYGRIIKLLALTGCRREEIAGLRWGEIDLNARVITLPPERTKNGTAHTVPLSDTAAEIIQTVRYRRGFVFGYAATGFAGFSKPKLALDKASGVSNWTVHDIRRTVRTGLGALGIQPHIAEAVLNHLPPKLVRTYDRNTYLAEKRAALDAWANHLRVIISGATNVQRLRA